MGSDKNVIRETVPSPQRVFLTKNARKNAGTPLALLRGAGGLNIYGREP
jgi:hypothetical protein